MFFTFREIDFDDLDGREKLSPMDIRKGMKGVSAQLPYMGMKDSQISQSRRQSEPFVKQDEDQMEYQNYASGRISARRKNVSGGVQSRLIHRANIGDDFVPSDRDERFSDFDERLSDRERVARRGPGFDDWDTVSERGALSRSHRSTGGGSGKRRRASEAVRRNNYYNRFANKGCFYSLSYKVDGNFFWTFGTFWQVYVIELTNRGKKLRKN